MSSRILEKITQKELIFYLGYIYINKLYKLYPVNNSQINP